MYKIGIDMGGTFTDICLLDENGKMNTAKVPTNKDNLEGTFVQGVDAIAKALGKSTEQLLMNTDLVVNGTTVASNAAVERKTGSTGLITTAGFRDIIFIGVTHQKVAGLSPTELRDYYLHEKAVPLVPRTMVEEVYERIDYKGAVVCPIDEADVRRAVKNLVDQGAVTIAVSLLFSFKNPKHEEEIRRIINEMYPEVYVSISSEICPKIREYQRTATTVVNAFVTPVVNDYINAIDKSLKSNGFKYEPLIMHACGGANLPSIIKRKPVVLLGSGPTGGVIGCQILARDLGHENIIATDVGGTTFDIGLIESGDPLTREEFFIGKYAVQSPAVTVDSIGAGGGGIAWIDDQGIMKVGPQSAGAVPGPVCYDQGGILPTLTDAMLVLGYLDPDYFAAGDIPLNKEKAVRAISDLATKLNKDTTAVAKGIYDIVCAQCSDLIRSFVVERSYDPRDFVLFAYGGGGPTLANAYAKELGIKELIIPRTAAVHSAFGCMSSDILGIHELSDHRPMPVDPEIIRANFAQLEKEALAEFASVGIKKEDTEVKRRGVTMKFGVQFKELDVHLDDLSDEELGNLQQKFTKIYDERYGKGTAPAMSTIDIITYKLEMVVKAPKAFLEKVEPGSADVSAALKETRDAFFDGKFIKTNIYDFLKLKAGMIIEGPAIIEDPFTTYVILPGSKARFDEYLNAHIEL
ncbi:MAG: hydantoinase/oxoprolinase family protein [Pseudomonadota bacterium]